MSKERISEATEFAQDNLPAIIAIAATTAGASIMLLIRYYRNKRKKDLLSENDSDLDTLDKIAQTGSVIPALLLDTGEAVMGAIPESVELANELAEVIPDPEMKKNMKTLSQQG